MKARPATMSGLERNGWVADRSLHAGGHGGEGSGWERRVGRGPEPCDGRAGRLTLRIRSQGRYGGCDGGRSRTQDPRGDRRAAAAVLPGVARDRRAPGRHDLVRAPRRARRCERGEGAEGPLVSRLLRHPGRRLRRRVPPPRDQSRARTHPRLAGRHRRHREPGPRRWRTTGASAPAGFGSWRWWTPIPHSSARW